MKIKVGQIWQACNRYNGLNWDESITLRVEDVENVGFWGAVIESTLPDTRKQTRLRYYFSDVKETDINWRLVRDVGLTCYECKKHYPNAEREFNKTTMLCWVCEVKDLSETIL